MKQALKQSKLSIDVYKKAVTTYRNAESKEQKREMEALIGEIKTNFRSEINSNDPKLIKLYKLKGEHSILTSQTGLFELSRKEETEQNKKVKTTSEEIKKLETEIDKIKSNKIYENAFEWRFDFPDVLNDEGDFVGFDVVIGNPPYLSVREDNNISKKYYYENYKVSENQLDLYHLFIERTNSILNKCDISSLIIPNSFLGNYNNQNLRNFILDNYKINKLININEDVFEEASVELIIFLFEKTIEK